VERICNHRYFGCNRTLQYLIHWKGYPDSNDTWESAADTHMPNLVKAYYKGTPLENIKAGQLSLQTPISLHPGSRSRTSRLGRRSLGSTPNSSSPVISSLSDPSTAVHNSQIPRLPTWTMYPSHSRPHSQTSILLPRTPLHLSPLMASTTPSSISATPLCPPCQITPSMP